MSEKIIDISIEEWLIKHPAMPIIVDDSVPVKTVAQRMLNENRRDAYVCEQGKIRGHLSFIKVMSYLFSCESRVQTRRHLFARVTDSAIDELMDPHFQYCKPDEMLSDVLHRQLQSGTDDLLVLDNNNRLIGVIKLTEVLKESLL